MKHISLLGLVSFTLLLVPRVEITILAGRLWLKTVHDWFPLGLPALWWTRPRDCL